MLCNKAYLKKCIAGFILVLFAISLTACGDDDSRQEQLDTLENAQRKEYTGEKMTGREERTLESFKEWKDNQD
ncbi:hypothetical protein [Metaclostridioides mangenotii]|uniref:hypothetical protein n=1 Tax=Metaclostridioides mangenotii TaxID=1540 RepID=UPI0028E6969E|nr:hypothetical protein [Clostridioides mangenotii]